MKILMAHNRYQIRAGEDLVFDQERQLLEESGFEVQTFIMDNLTINTSWRVFLTAVGSIFSLPSFFRFRKKLREFKPDVVHVHNLFPQLSPSVLYACYWEKIPVVMTLHNFRLICPTSTLSYQGKVCERSIKSPLWATLRPIYRGSRIATTLLVVNIEFHKLIGTWERTVTRFIALTNFAKAKFAEAGLPRDRIAVKPNFISMPSSSAPDANGDYALYLGRLTEEKGVRTLIQAWANVDIPLYIAGEGPLEELVRKHCGENLHYLGHLDSEEVWRRISESAFLVVPSQWYEGFPMVLLEAFASRTPIVASKIGSLEELVSLTQAGLTFEPGDAQALADAANQLANNPTLRTEAGESGYKAYEELFSPAAAKESLSQIYEAAIES